MNKLKSAVKLMEAFLIQVAQEDVETLKNLPQVLFLKDLKVALMNTNEITLTQAETIIMNADVFLSEYNPDDEDLKNLINICVKTALLVKQKLAPALDCPSVCWSKIVKISIDA